MTVAVRPRIVILTEDSKPATGGIAEYLHRLAIAASATHEIIVVTTVAGAEALNPDLPFRYREAAWFRGQDPRPGDRYAPLRRANTVVWQLGRRRRARAMLARLAAERPGTTFLLGRVSPVTDPWCRACDDLGIPYLAIGYGLELVVALSPRSAFRRRRAVRSAQHWFVVSRATQRLLGDIGVTPDRVTILPPGVPVEPLPDALTRRAARRVAGVGDAPFVLSIGQLRRRKGIDLAIEAFAAVASTYPTLRHVIVGDGAERAALDRLTRALGVSARVTILDSVGEATKDALLAECALFVLPVRPHAADFEGFGIVFLEAARHGKAVIAGAVDGVPEAVADGISGILVDTARGAPEVARALERLLGDAQLADRLGTEARARAERDFAWASRGQVFGATLARIQVATAERGGVGERASNRVRAGAERARMAARLAGRGRLWRYLTPGPVPRDLAELRSAVGAWVHRALVPGSRSLRSAGAEGASAGYHVVQGWAAPYPEVTGYLIPTLLRDGDTVSHAAALRAGEWLAQTRLPSGAICRKQWQPGVTDPSVFNTAQVIEGWCALADHRGDASWLALARQSADWILGEQEADGSWIRSAFNGISHSYYARVGGILSELGGRVGAEGGSAYAQSGRRALDWVMTQQRPDGWFDRAGFGSEAPTTHGIGYVLEGLLRGGAALGDDRYIAAAERGAGALRRAYDLHGRLPGRFGPGWSSAARWRCITGEAQIGLVWSRLARITGLPGYAAAAERVADAVRRSVRTSVTWPELSGGVPGAAPRGVGYDPFAYPTHAAKFALDLAVELGG